jgi:hypothetical protein
MGRRRGTVSAVLKDICIDVSSPWQAKAFWSLALGYHHDGFDDEDREWFASLGRTEETCHVLKLVGDGPPVWLCEVPEPKTAKSRVHLDVIGVPVADLVAAGATVVREPDDEVSWTVLLCPDGNELCVFL